MGVDFINQRLLEPICASCIAWLPAENVRSE